MTTPRLPDEVLQHLFRQYADAREIYLARAEDYDLWQIAVAHCGAFQAAMIEKRVIH